MRRKMVECRTKAKRPALTPMAEVEMMTLAVVGDRCLSSNIILSRDWASA